MMNMMTSMSDDDNDDNVENLVVGTSDVPGLLSRKDLTESPMSDPER